MKVFEYLEPVCAECRDMMYPWMEVGLPFMRGVCQNQTCSQVGIVKRFRLRELDYEIVDTLKVESDAEEQTQF